MGFGFKTKELQGSRINNGLCTHCSAEAVFNAGTIKLLHFWGIPLLPIYASAKVRCANCGSVVKLRKASSEARANATSPITPKALLTASWGIAVALLAIAGLLVLGFLGKQQEQQKLAAPMPGDIYIVKIAEFEPSFNQPTFPYSLFKISSVEGQNVHFVYAKRVFGNIKSVRKSLSDDGAKSDFYAPEQHRVDLATLKRRYDAGAIKEIKR